MQEVALVTGAGSGLGQGLARFLAEHGYDIALHTGSNEERALDFASKLRESSGRRVEVFCSDFTKDGTAAVLFDWFRGEFDRLDLFVNNAGLTKMGQILSMTEELYNTVFNVNFKNAYFCVQQAAGIMKEQKTAGSIFLISSNHHATVGIGNSAYSISKESLVKLAKHAAMEFARYNIRVNCIAPGWVNTGEARLEGYYESSLKEIPLHRWVQPSEIGEWILFLSGPAAYSLTGDTIELDGGVRLMSGRPEYYC